MLASSSPVCFAFWTTLASVVYHAVDDRKRRNARYGLYVYYVVGLRVVSFSKGEDEQRSKIAGHILQAI